MIDDPNQCLHLTVEIVEEIHAEVITQFGEKVLPHPPTPVSWRIIAARPAAIATCTPGHRKNRS